MKKGITTIKMSKDVVKELSTLKIHPRQAYEEVVVELLDFYKEKEIKFGNRTRKNIWIREIIEI